MIYNVKCVSLQYKYIQYESFNTHYDVSKHVLSFLVADDGIGVQASLSENEEYVGISGPEALRICIKDAITDGKGIGFGLYSTSLLVRDAGLRFDNELEELW